MTAAATPLIRAERVCKRFSERRSLFHREVLDAVRSVDLTINRGETVVLVGESGSGKSTLGRMLVRLEQPTSGSVWLDGTDIARLRGAALRRYRQRVSIVFQNPYRSLNPRMRVGRAIAEPLRVWGIVPPGEIPDEVERLIQSVGLPAAYAGRLPHELSGGERQRIAIARALSVRPEFMVADEAVSSLDVSAAAEVLNLMITLRRDVGLSCLFVTHDLGVARVLADRIAVMRHGEIVETGTPAELLTRPRHDYTKLLLDSQLLVNPPDASRPEGAPEPIRLGLP